MKKELKLTALDNMCLLIKTHGKTEVNGKRGNSDSTLAHAKFLCLINNQLVDAGFNINNIADLQQKHLKYLAKKWEADGLSPSTMQKRWSHLKLVLENWCGRTGTVKNLEKYLGKR